MIEEYPSRPEGLTDKPLPEEFYPLAGRLVRAFADFEDLVLRALAARVGVDSDQVRLLIGFQPLSKLNELLSYVAKTTGPECESMFAPVLDAIKGPMKVRNIACHATYIGTDASNNLFFLTNKLLTYPSSGQLNFEAVGISIETLANAVERMDIMLPALTEAWQLETSLKTHLQRQLKDHPKAQNAHQRQKGRIPRQKSSPE